jgi:hypothetical protein
MNSVDGAALEILYHHFRSTWASWEFMILSRATAVNEDAENVSMAQE